MDFQAAAAQCTLMMPQDEASAAFKQLFMTFLKLQRRLEEVLEPHGLVLSQFEAWPKSPSNRG